MTDSSVPSEPCADISRRKESLTRLRTAKSAFDAWPPLRGAANSKRALARRIGRLQSSNSRLPGAARPPA